MDGGGGGGDDYSERQAAIEAKKAEARTRLNEMFGQGDTASAKSNAASRDALYGTIRDNAFAAGKRGLDETKTNAERNNKFELFARGLNGGSEDIDQNALLNRTYNQGLLDLGAKADAAKTSFKSNDEATRLNLLQSIDAGMDQSSALSSAVNQMKNASDQAAADAQGTTLGNLFDSANLIYSQSQARKGKQDAIDWWNTYNTGSNSRKTYQPLYSNT